MSDFFFVIRMMILTVIIVIIMQIKIGPSTIEQYSQEWIHNSAVVGSLRLVSDGAVKVLTQSYKAVVTSLDTNIGKVFRKDQMPGARQAGFSFKRSDEYYKNTDAKKAASAAEAVEESSSESDNPTQTSVPQDEGAQD